MDESRIVLVRGNNSQWYEQAIFILKNPVAAKNKDLVFEAEKIINDYMSSGRAGLLPPKLEAYKKAVLERASANKATFPSAKEDAGAPAKNSLSSPEREGTCRSKNIDFTSLFIGASLIISCILFGAVLHGIMTL